MVWKEKTSWDHAMKSRAAILIKPNRPLQLTEVDVAAPKAGEVLVQMVATGICHTDISVIQGKFSAPLPIIVGHEGAAIVKAVGPRVSELQVGDHVVITALPHCGHCRFCQSAQPYYCDGLPDTSFEGTMPDGTSRFSQDGRPINHLFCQSSFSEYAIVMQSACVKVSKKFPLQTLAPLGCGVMTGAGAVMNCAKVGVGDKVVIIGCGGVGLAAVMAAKLSGALEIIAIDIQEKRLKLAKELGATKTAKAATFHDADFAFECVGHQETIAQCLKSIRAGGTAVITGACSDGLDFAIDPSDLLLKNIKGNIAGMCVAQLFIPQLLEYHKRGLFPFDRLTTKVYPFEEINQAIQDMIKGKVIKPIVTYR